MSLPYLLVYGGGDEGGAVEYLLHLISNLDRRKFRPLFVSMGRDALERRIEEYGIDYVKANTPAAVAQFARTSGASFFHTHGVRANFAGRIAAFMAGVPTVTTVHSMISLDYVRAPMRIAATFMDNATLPMARRVIAISNAIAQDAIRRGVAPDRIRVVHNGIPPAPEPDRDGVRAELGLDEGTLGIVTVARLHPVKGINYLLEAVAQLGDGVTPWRLYIAGDGPIREALVEQTRSLGLGDRVRFLGHVSGVRRLLPGFDLYVSPSLMEGLGLSIIEAMAADLPIVATGVGGVTELIEDGRSGLLVPPEDTLALLDAIRRALSDRTMSSALAREAHDRFAQYFTVERFTRATENVYREVLN